MPFSANLENQLKHSVESILKAHFFLLIVFVATGNIPSIITIRLLKLLLLSGD